MKKMALALSAGMLLATTGCSIQPANDNCVNLIVDSRSIGGDRSESCIAISGNTDASSVLSAAGFEVTGTAKYGLQIICRVNGLPKETQVIGTHTDYREKCADMPAEFAYWALLVRTPEKDWAYAPVGIADLTVNPKEQIALVFSVDEKMELPN